MSYQLRDLTVNVLYPQIAMTGWGGPDEDDGNGEDDDESTPGHGDTPGAQTDEDGDEGSGSEDCEQETRSAALESLRIQLRSTLDLA